MTTSKRTKLRRTLSYIAAVVALLALVLTAVAFTTAGTSTTQFTDEHGEPIANAIAEERYMMIGGMEQYVLLRGRDRTAPLLVFVHGGPGVPETPFLRTYNDVLEDEFVVVYWEQRGALRSFDEGLDSAEMTIDRLTADLGDLIDQLLVEFNQEQVLLVAHSWGTVLGLEYTAQRPETVAAYIAMSQTTNQMASDAEGYEWALAQAKAAGDEEAQTALETLGPPPYTIEQFVTQRRYVNIFGGSLIEHQSDFDLLRIMLATDEFSWTWVNTWLKGNRFSGASLWDEQQQYDAAARHSQLDAPYYLLHGRHDRVISPALAEAFFDQLDAPSKELIWFEQSAHSPLIEEPEAFNNTIIQIAQDVGMISE